MPTLGLSDGSSVRIAVTAFDHALQNHSEYLECLVATSPPPAVQDFWIPNASLLGATAYAIDPLNAQSRHVCWQPPPEQPVAHYLVWSAPHEAVGNPSPRQVNASTLCLEDTSVVVESDGPYYVRVAAVSHAGLRGLPAEITLIPDGSPPVLPRPPIIHTGALSPVHQTSDCCLRVSWEPWLEAETTVMGYEL